MASLPHIQGLNQIYPSISKNTPSWLSSLPVSVGDIQSFQWTPTPRQSPLVVLIQDAHDIDSAQMNISRMLDHMTSQSSEPLLIGLEGAAGRLDPMSSLSCAHQSHQELISTFLLGRKILSGPEHFALSSGRSSLLWGVEDPALYNDNVQAYRDGHHHIRRFKDHLQNFTQALDPAKREHYTPALWLLDRNLEAYHQGQFTLLQIAEFLSRLVPDLSAYPEVDKLIHALGIEQALDLEKVESEKNTLVAALSNQLSSAELESLVQMAQAYRSGQLSYARFYRTLRSLAEKEEISLDGYPAFAQYIDFALLSETIEIRPLFDQLDQLKREALAGAGKTSQQKELLFLSNDLRLLDKLANFSFTPLEWKEFRSRKQALQNWPQRVSTLNGAPLSVPDFSTTLATFEKFYQAADARNHAMVSRLLQKAKEIQSSTMVLVTGGFHTPELQRLFQARGVSTVTVTPKMQLTNQGSSYLNLFSVRDMPLEKMVLGEKLFISRERSLAQPMGSNSQSMTPSGLRGLWPELQTTLHTAENSGWGAVASQTVPGVSFVGWTTENGPPSDSQLTPQQRSAATSHQNLNLAATRLPAQHASRQGQHLYSGFLTALAVVLFLVFYQQWEQASLWVQLLILFGGIAYPLSLTWRISRKLPTGFIASTRAGKTTMGDQELSGALELYVNAEESIHSFTTNWAQTAMDQFRPLRWIDEMIAKSVALLSYMVLFPVYSLVQLLVLVVMALPSGDLIQPPFNNVPPFQIIQRVQNETLSAEQILNQIDDRLIADTVLMAEKTKLMTLIRDYRDSGQLHQTAEKVQKFSQSFNNLDLSEGFPPSVQERFPGRYDIKDVFQMMMIAKSTFCRELAIAGPITEPLLESAVSSIRSFVEEKVERGDMKPSSLAQVDVAETFMKEWLSEGEIPKHIKQGLVRAMIEGRNDDLLFAFGPGWRQFGTAGIRNPAVNSSFAGVQLLELEEFARDPHAPVLAGPNTINLVTLLQQTATARLIIKSIQNYAWKHRGATRMKLSDLLHDAGLLAQAQQSGSVPDVTIELPDSFRRDLEQNKVTFAYDSRLNGPYWSHVLGADFLRDGIGVDQFENVAGMPSLVYAANRGQSIFGFLISASHSEPNFNGFKFVVGYMASQVSPEFQQMIMTFRNLVSYSDMSLDLAVAEQSTLQRIQTENVERVHLLGNREGNGHVNIYDQYYPHVKERSPVTQLLSTMNETPRDRLARQIEDERKKMNILYTAFSGAGAVNAGNFPGFMNTMGYESVDLIGPHTNEVNGRFPAFIKGWTLGMPDPGSLEANVVNFVDFLIQEAGPQLEQIEAACRKFNAYDLSLSTDPDIDRAAMVISLPKGVRGNVNEPLLVALEEYIDEAVPEENRESLKERVRGLFKTQLNDKLHITANDAWMFVVHNNLAMLEQQGQLRKDKVYTILKSHVTTSGLEDIAAAYREKGYHVYVVDTFVGFTLLAEGADQLFNFAKKAWQVVNLGRSMQGQSLGDVDSAATTLQTLRFELEEVYEPLEGRLPLVDELMADVRGLRLGERAAWDVTLEEIQPVVEKLKLVANLEIVAGLEESNGYGEFGRIKAELDNQAEIVDEHVREKDGALAAYKVAELNAYLRATGKTLYEAYMEMLGNIGTITSTENLFTRYPGAAGVSAKVNNINWFEKFLAYVTGSYADRGETPTFFGKYTLDLEGGRPSTVVFRGRKYDENYLGFPEEGIQFRLTRQYKGTSYKIIVTYRPSGTGMENRDYNWAIAVIPGPARNSIGQIEPLRQEVQEVLAEMKQDFFGDPSQKGSATQGLLLAMQEGGQSEFQNLFGRAIGQSTPLEFESAEERKLFAASQKFADASRQLKGKVDAQARKKWAQERQGVQEESQLAWSRYLDQHAAEYPVKIEVQYQGTVLIEIPRAAAVAWVVSAADYVVSLLPETDFNFDDVTSSDPEFLKWIQVLHEQNQVAQSSLPDQGGRGGQRADRSEQVFYSVFATVILAVLAWIFFEPQSVSLLPLSLGLSVGVASLALTSLAVTWYLSFSLPSGTLALTSGGRTQWLPGFQQLGGLQRIYVQVEEFVHRQTTGLFPGLVNQGLAWRLDEALAKTVGVILTAIVAVPYAGLVGVSRVSRAVPLTRPSSSSEGLIPRSRGLSSLNLTRQQINQLIGNNQNLLALLTNPEKVSQLRSLLLAHPDTQASQVVSAVTALTQGAREFDQMIQQGAEAAQASVVPFVVQVLFSLRSIEAATPTHVGAPVVQALTRGIFNLGDQLDTPEAAAAFRQEVTGIQDALRQGTVVPVRSVALARKVEDREIGIYNAARGLDGNFPPVAYFNDIGQSNTDVPVLLTDGATDLRAHLESHAPNHPGVRTLLSRAVLHQVESSNQQADIQAIWAGVTGNPLYSLTGEALDSVTTYAGSSIQLIASQNLRGVRYQSWALNQLYEVQDWRVWNDLQSRIQRLKDIAIFA